ncbi:MAG TPA: tetratricopeptide repeat protein [Kofleriaceae bacterium]|nr:tetratricopeptide repeat protein [Kofleriaceae bacterium]
MSDVMDAAVGLVQRRDFAGARALLQREVDAGRATGGEKLLLLDVLDRLHDHAAVLALADDLDGRSGPVGGRHVVVHSAAIGIARARALHATNRNHEAAAAAREAIAELDRNGGVVAGFTGLGPHLAYSTLGSVEVALERFEAGIEAYQQALSRWDRRSDRDCEHCAHFDLGNAYKGIGDLGAALASTRRAIELEPGHADSWFNLACYYALLGYPDDAVSALTRSIGLARDNAASARDDPDFASLRDDPRFVELTR